MIELHPIFKLREDASDGLLKLLKSVSLGTNGAIYRHLNTSSRIKELDAPLHLSMERNEKVIGNITFCRRGKDWYIRYFAFDKLMQSGGKKKSTSRSGFLKKELQKFFDSQLESEVDQFYAYIDPANVKSKWISENMGFEKVGQVATQTYSRLSLPSITNVIQTTNWTELENKIQDQFGDRMFYFEAQVKKGPFYSLTNEYGELIACAKVTKAEWRIDRLPGKLGGGLVKILPWIPFLNRVLNPKRHEFIVPDSVYVKNNDPKVLDELFSGILVHEKCNLMIWWTDVNDPLYKSASDNVRWGVLHRLIGVNTAAVVVNKKSEASQKEQLMYISGIDFI